MSKAKNISDLSVITPLYEAFISRMMKIPLDDEGEIRAVICELCITKKDENLNNRIRTYVKAYSKHHEIDLAEAVSMMMSEISADLSLVYEDEKGKTQKLSLPDLAVPEKLSAESFAGSVQSIGTHSTKYANSSSKLDAISHYRREAEDKENLAIQVTNASLSRYAKFMSLRMRSGMISDLLASTDREDWSVRAVESGNTDESQDLNLLSNMMSSALDIKKSDFLTMLENISFIIKERGEAPDILSGMSETGKIWSLPTVILPFDNGDDIQVSVLTSHQARKNVGKVKGQIISLSKSIKKIKNGSVTQRLLEGVKPKKKRGEKQSDTQELANMEMDLVEASIDKALEDYPESLKEAVIPLHLSELKDEELAKRIMLLDEVKKNMAALERMFWKTLSVYAQPQNAYLGAQGTVSLLGREPYFFYKKDRNRIAEFIEDKKGSYLPIDVTTLLPSIKSLMILSFDGQEVLIDEVRGKREDSRPIKSGKARRAAIAALKKGLMQEISQVLDELFDHVDDENREDVMNRAFPENGNMLHKSFSRCIKHAIKNEDEKKWSSQSKMINTVMSDKDVLYALSEINEHFRREVS